ncbi:hypothetical protein [Amycolatopsis magusensis]|uniref:hypothetical protein n=1 Tax=Amycolatopsis magusensis TaxID=882444 RepID=UPI003C2E98A2
MPETTKPAATHPAELVNRTVHLAEAARTGRLAALDALTKVEAEVLGYVRHMQTMAAVHQAEITAATDGKVAADPKPTSSQAARRVAPRTGTQRGAVLAFIVEHGGATDHEIARGLSMLDSSVRPRRGELVEGGYVTDSGRTREHQGSPWVIWTATPSGNAWQSMINGEARRA